MKTKKYPKPGSRWNYPTSSVEDNRNYTVLFITNVAHKHKAHPPQVIYQGDNGLFWSLPLAKWPGKLRQIPKPKSKPKSIDPCDQCRFEDTCDKHFNNCPLAK